MEKLLDSRYELQEMLGKGAQGEVYRAWDWAMNQPVAIKLLEHGDEATLREEFASIAGLKHPNLVSVRDLGVGPQGLYYTMDLVAGVSTQMVQWKKSCDLWLLLLRQSLSALSYLHSKSLIHRDLKPGNLLISGSGIQRGLGPEELFLAASRCPDLRLRIGDFGLLCAQGEGGVHPAGTLEYLAPEAFQVQPGPSGDLYSLGVSFYELVMGELPPGFGGVYRFLQPPQPLPELEGAPAWLSEFIHCLTAPFPEQRFASAHAALAELDGFHPAISEAWRPQEAELLGRASELAMLESCMETAFLSKRGSLMQVIGPAGSGKSRLLRELDIRAQLRGHGVVHRDGVSGLELLTLPSTESVQFDAEGSLQERVSAWLGTLDRHYRQALRKPTLLILDLHEPIEPACLPLLERLGAVLSVYPLFIVLAWREPLLISWERIQLGPLDSELMNDLLIGLTGARQPRPDFLRQMHSRAEGLPGKLIRLLSRLADGRRILRRAGVWNFELEDLPEAAWDEAQEEEARRLAPELLEVLKMASILDPLFQELHLQSLLGRPIDEALQTLARSGFLRPSKEGWRFGSAELREELYLSMPESMHLELHRRAAELMQRRSRPWLRQQAAGPEPLDAIEALQELASAYEREGRMAERVSILRRAQRRAESIPGAAAAELRLGLAQAHLDQGEASAAAELLKDSVHASTESALLYAKALVEQKLNAQAIELLESLQLDETTAPHLRIDRLHHLANALLQANSPEKAQECLRQALELAKASENPAKLAQILIGLGNALRRTSRLAEAQEAYEQAASLLEPLQDFRRLAICLNGQGVVAFSLGSMQRAESLLDKALLLQDRSGSLDAQMTIRMNLGVVCFQNGSLERARELYRQAAALAERLRASPHETVRCLNNQALIEMRLEALDRALALLERAAQLCLQHDLPLEGAIVAGNIGEVRLKYGELERARGAFEGCLNKARALHSEEFEVECLRRLGELALRQASLLEAEQLLESALSRAAGLGLLLEKALDLFALGRLRLAQERTTEARKLLEEALQSFEQLQAPFERAQVLSTLALVRAASGAALDLTLLDEAIELYNRMGVRRQAERLLEHKRAFLAERKGTPTTRKRLETLLELTAKLSRSLQLEPLLHDIIESVLAFTGAERGAVLLCSETGSLQPTIALDRSRAVLPTDTLRISQSVLRQVLQTKTPVCLTNLSLDPNSAPSESISELKLMTVMCVPLQIEERLLGLLYVDDQLRSRSVYSEEDLSFLLALASHAAIALHKAQMYADLERSFGKLQHTLDYLRRTKEELNYHELLAQTDELTGLYNRRCFNEQSAKLIGLALSTDTSWALVLIDLDGFKQINDRLGHGAGDHVLKAIASALRHCIRKNDLPCRLGGDEFAVLLPDTSEAEARLCAERIREAIAQLPLGLTEEITVTASLGGTLHQRGEPFAQLFERADQSLYEAKKTGKNCLCWGGTLQVQ